MGRLFFLVSIFVFTSTSIYAEGFDLHGTYNDRDSIAHIVSCFLSGLIVLIILSWIVRAVVYWLKKSGGILKDSKREKSPGLSTRFAIIEQFLFFLASIAGKEVFGFALGGWLVFKGIHRWSRWDHVPGSVKIPLELKGREKLMPSHFSYDEIYDAIARRRFMVFLIGTGMSIATGGISGAVYHMLRNI